MPKHAQTASAGGKGDERNRFTLAQVLSRDRAVTASRRRRNRTRRVLLASACVCGWLHAASAGTDEEIFRELRFNFTVPGARAMALGGAFVAVADDATAAEANPAGLARLDHGQVFVEYRSSSGGDAASTGSSLGSLVVDPVTGARDLPYLSLASRSNAEDSGALSFIGFVWPLTLGSEARRLTVSGSRQVIFSAERSLPSTGEQTQARFSFDSFPNTVRDEQVEAYSVVTPVTGRTEAEVVYWNASAAYQIHQDFSVGATLAYATLDFQATSSTQVIDPLELYLDPSHPRLPAQPTADIYDTEVDGSDSAFTYSLGFQWHPVSPFREGKSSWRFGAVFRKGARFAAPETTRLNGLPDQSFDNDFIVPDRYAVGGSYAWGQRWLLAAQLERIEYSDLLEGYRSGVNFFTSGRVVDGSFTTDPNRSVQYTVDDGTFFRGGAEYLVPLGGQHQRDLAVRVGYYRAPDNRIRMTEFNSTDPEVNAMYLAAFPAGGDASHVTAGVGYAIGSSSFHLAIDSSSQDGDKIVGSYALILGTKKK